MGRTCLYQLVHVIWSSWLYQLQRYDWGKIKRTGHVTLTTPLLGVVCHRPRMVWLLEFRWDFLALEN